MAFKFTYRRNKTFFKVYVFNESYKNVLHILCIIEFIKSNKNVEENMHCWYQINGNLSISYIFQCRFLITFLLKAIDVSVFMHCLMLVLIPPLKKHLSQLCALWKTQWHVRVSHMLKVLVAWECKVNTSSSSRVMGPVREMSCGNRGGGFLLQRRTQRSFLEKLVFKQLWRSLWRSVHRGLTIGSYSQAYAFFCSFLLNLKSEPIFLGILK